MTKSKMPEKIKIFDTNVFLADPHALFNYPNELVVIPISVIEEIDEFKKSLNELGANARHVLRKIDKLRKRGKISSANPISTRSKNVLPGIPLNNGGRLIIEINHTDSIPDGLTKDKVDNRILAVAIYYNKKYPKSDVQLITTDANLRIKADTFDVKASNYEKATDLVSDALYQGYREIMVSDVDYKVLRDQHKLQLLDLKKPLLPNEYVKIFTENEENPILVKHTIVDLNDESSAPTPNLVRKIDKKQVSMLKENWNLEPNNDEQRFALDALLDPTIPLITISGKAGTGKTLLAVAAGLYLTADLDKFDKLLISRPVFPMGKDIGYLPGTIEEKMNPWMQPIFDNLEFLFGKGEKKKFTKSSKRDTFASHEDLIKGNILKVEPLMYIRGRSIPNQFIIIDEAQNLSLHEIKTIITRAGKNTKIIFTGDPDQIDSPYLDSISNGLTQIIERFKDEKLAAHINLSKGERSPLADLASEKLK